MKPYAAISGVFLRLRRSAELKSLRRESDGVLREILLLSPADRRTRIGHRDVRAALIALGKDRGIAWLGTALESPVGDEWGSALYALRPRWEHLDCWVHRSKEHCLAAIDALLMFGPRLALGERNPRHLPEGADNAKINELINEALRLYANPRLRMAERRIRDWWPTGPRPRHAVTIPAEIRRAADVLLRSRSSWMGEWIDDLETSLDRPSGATDFWWSLIRFCDHRDLVVWGDWNAEPIDIVSRLRKSPSARDVTLPWLLFERFNGTTDELCMAMGDAVRQSGHAFIQLDTGGDDMALAIIPADSIEVFRSIAESCFGIPLHSRDENVDDNVPHWRCW